MKKTIIPLLCALLTVMITVSFCACGSTKSSDKKSQNKNSSSEATDYASLYDYAKELEKNGNIEAAEAVYELIIEGGGAELIEEAHEDIPIIRFADDYEQISDAFEKWKGVDEQ